MKVCVFGSGYVGLTQAACLAESGHSVYCVDIDVQRIEHLNLPNAPTAWRVSKKPGAIHSAHLTCPEVMDTSRLHNSLPTH